ncbi:hypothetical protein SCREM2_gp16 [Synechococcus phage S-CREM2]|nr:hypothetical protein SCREM2_gp16 [Synechococcus phage S-CREM2]
MTSSEFTTEDICNFAEHLGLTGVDADLFYEAYYAMDPTASDLQILEDYEEMWELA